MTCPKCKEGQMKEIDRETNTFEQTHVLLECDKCSYTIIEPEKK